MNKNIILKNKYILIILSAVILVVIFFQINKTKNGTVLKTAPAQLSISGANETALKAMEAIPQICDHARFSAERSAPPTAASTLVP